VRSWIFRNIHRLSAIHARRAGPAVHRPLQRGPGGVELVPAPRRAFPAAR
jgi:hypothetical protein